MTKDECIALICEELNTVQDYNFIMTLYFLIVMHNKGSD